LCDEPELESAQSLSRSVIERDESRPATEHAVPEVADHLLPGVGAEEMPLREGLAIGGSMTFVVLLLLNTLDELEAAALTVLAPEIRDAFDVSDGVIVFLASASTAFVFLGAMPLGWLADRVRRGPIIGVSGLLFGLFTLLSGLAINVTTFFLARLGTGIAKANTLPVHGSLMADTYPIAVRGRMAAINVMAGRGINVISPIAVGAIAAWASWRWTYGVLWIPVAVVALAAFRLPEPVRGRWEKAHVLETSVDNAEIVDEKTTPISIEAAFNRLNKVRTLRSVMLGFAALGFGLFTRPVLASLFLEDEYELGAFGRGTITTASGLMIIAVVPFVGRYFDQLYRRDPTRALALIGALIMPSALLMPIQYAMPNEYLFAAFDIPGSVMMFAAFAMVQPLMQAVVPYRLRGMGAALGTLYIFLVGAAGGGLLAAALINTGTPRSTVLILGLPSSIIGGALMLNGARHIRDDLAATVAELQEEHEEYARQAADPASIPVIQVNNVDFSYRGGGSDVQVLFDVGFEVHRGETLALLGTNGAGKSTILKVIAGLETPERGVVRLNGATLTFASPETRSALGIHLLAGGAGVWGPMSVRHNLEMATHMYRHDTDDVERRIDRVLELFPEMRGHLDQPAGTLSGGQQQTLALALSLLHEPEILIIDELSLGLAPVAVARLMAEVERLQQEGQTMLIVEQSINLALQIADRAVFLEKGSVRFEGPTAELAGRDDLVRAVFLGSDGG
jgi:ABC-type branched-subunit amino acid transport system ATPase component/predicted MFS family arabinose efflux permease